MWRFESSLGQKNGDLRVAFFSGPRERTRNGGTARPAGSAILHGRRISAEGGLEEGNTMLPTGRRVLSRAQKQIEQLARAAFFVSGEDSKRSERRAIARMSGQGWPRKRM
ncbi:MAG: hypothetical protein EA383_05200 [Spirochaetaceae bacterium]|nr:MAG: hypothetical protein EA383_05200 [Spirochaetaceae bacterium]